LRALERDLNPAQEPADCDASPNIVKIEVDAFSEFAIAVREFHGLPRERHKPEILPPLVAFNGPKRRSALCLD